MHFCIMELRIKEVAKENGFQIIDLAKLLGVSRRTMYHWINGKLTVADLERVAKQLNCCIYELIEPTDGLSFIYDENGNFKGLSK